MKENWRARGAFVVASFLVFLAACNRSGKAVATHAIDAPIPPATSVDSGGSPSSTAEESMEPLPRVDPGVVKLIDSGREPRQALRYALRPRDRQSVEIIRSTTLSSIDVPLPHPLSADPALVVTLELEVSDVTREGDSTSLVSITHAQTKPPTPPEETVLPLLVGQRGRLAMNARGLGPRVKFSLTPLPAAHQADLPTVRALVAELETALTELSTPVPEEPVGKGASWQHVVTRPSGLAGPVPVTETALYKLVDLQADAMTIEVAIDRSASSAVTPANEAASEQTHDVSSKASDKRVFALERPLPTSTKRRTTTTIRTKPSSPEPGMPKQWTTKLTTGLDVVSR